MFLGTLTKYSSVEGWTTVSLIKYSNSSVCFAARAWILTLKSEFTIKRCITLIFSFTVHLLSICCLIFFEVFTQPLLLGKRYFFNCPPSSSIFSIVSFFAFSSNSDQRFRLSAALQDRTSAASGSFTCTCCLECPRHKLGNQSTLKRHQSLAGSPNRKCLLQSRSFSKIESVKSSLLIPEIHLLLLSAVNSSLVDNSTCTRKKAYFFGGGPYLFHFIGTSDDGVKNHDDKN